jgi:hypothetical protein
MPHGAALGLIIGIAALVAYWTLLNYVSHRGQVEDVEERQRTHQPARYEELDPRFVNWEPHEHPHAHHEDHTPTTQTERWLVVSLCMLIGVALSFFDTLHFRSVGHNFAYIVVYVVCVGWGFWAPIAVLGPGHKWRIWGYLGTVAGSAFISFFMFHFMWMIL